MGIHDMLQWWNLIYVVPLVVSVVWILTTVFSGIQAGGNHNLGHHDIGHHIGDVGHHVGNAVNHVFHHGDVGHGHADMHGHGSANGHGHGHADGDHHGHDDHSHRSHGNSASNLVDFVLGTKHIPLTLLIGIFLLCWGAFGLLSNRLFGILHYPGIYVWPSLVTTFFASSIVTRSMAAVFGRFLPTEETYGVTRFELVGSLGKAIHATNEHTGTIDIKDKYGTVHRVQAKVEPGKDSIPSGAEVIVVDYDEDGKYFLVRQGSL